MIHILSSTWTFLRISSLNYLWWVRSYYVAISYPNNIIWYIYIYTPGDPSSFMTKNAGIENLLQNIGPLFFSWKKCGPKTTTSLAMSKPLPWSDPKAPKSRPVVELRKKSRPWHRRFWSLSGDDRPKRRWGWFRVLLVGSKTPSQKLRSREWQ